MSWKSCMKQRSKTVKGFKKMKYLISTISDLAGEEVNGDEMRVFYEERTLPLAVENGLGLEFAEFCLTINMDENFESIRPDLERKATAVRLKTLHAPFNELYPMAIDPKVVKIAYERYDQAWKLALRFGAEKLIVHPNFVFEYYFESWFVERHVMFWKKFLAEHPEPVTICLENVTEDDPSLILGILEEVNDPRLRMCLDVGHANLSPVPPIEWLKMYGSLISHYHLHNHEGRKPGRRSNGDLHRALGNGIIDMKELLDTAERLTPNATAAIESYEPEACVEWLKKNGYI